MSRQPACPTTGRSRVDGHNLVSETRSARKGLALMRVGLMEHALRKGVKPRSPCTPDAENDCPFPLAGRAGKGESLNSLNVYEMLNNIFQTFESVR